MNNLLKRLKSTRGEGYVDITVAVLIIMILLAGVIKIAPVFITKMTLNSYANELCREAEIAGRIGTETTARLDRLNESHPDLAPTVTWSASGNIQIGRTFSVTVSTDYDFSCDEKGKVFTKTLWKYRVDSERIVDGKTVIDGRFVRVNPISKELRERMHENGVPNDVLDRFSEVR